MALNVEVCVVMTYFLEIKDEHSIEIEENNNKNNNNKAEFNWIEKITDFVITNFEGGVSPENNHVKKITANTNTVLFYFLFRKAKAACRSRTTWCS